MRQTMALCSMLIVLLTISIVSPAFASQQEPNVEFDITDGKNNTVHFDSPVEHIATIGVGVTDSVIQLGAGEKIVVQDNYSYKNKSAVFDQLRQLVDEGKAKADGTIYTTGSDALKTNIIDSADTGVFDKSKDVIILTGADTYLVDGGLITYFQSQGFRVLAWNDMTTYTSIVTFLEKISMIVSGAVSSKITEMSELPGEISSVLEQQGIQEKRNAFYVTFSGGVFKVGNTGSIATQMILAAGGKAVTVDSTKSGSTYEANLTELIEKFGKDTVIFADNSIVSNEANLKQLINQVNNDVKIVALDSLWNNYSLETQNGVWTMASAMYPDYFHGNVPTVNYQSEDNLTLYTQGGIIGAIVVAAVSFYITNKN